MLRIGFLSPPPWRRRRAAVWPLSVHPSRVFGPPRWGLGVPGRAAVAAVGVLVVLVALFRSWPARYGVLAGACLLVALAADNLNSLERYVFNGVPVVLGVATLAGYRRVGQLVPVVSGAAMVVLATAAWTGSYVP